MRQDFWIGVVLPKEENWLEINKLDMVFIVIHLWYQNISPTYSIKIKIYDDLERKIEYIFSYSWSEKKVVYLYGNSYLHILGG